MSHSDPQTADVERTDSTETAGDADAIEELLVEEVSIDGMCGVY